LLTYDPLHSHDSHESGGESVHPAE
jgi:hypothetical protein